MNMEDNDEIINLLYAILLYSILLYYNLNIIFLILWCIYTFNN